MDHQGPKEALALIEDALDSLCATRKGDKATAEGISAIATAVRYLDLLVAGRINPKCRERDLANAWTLISTTEARFELSNGSFLSVTRTGQVFLNGGARPLTAQDLKD